MENRAEGEEMNRTTSTRRLKRRGRSQRSVKLGSEIKIWMEERSGEGRVEDSKRDKERESRRSSGIKKKKESNETEQRSCDDLKSPFVEAVTLKSVLSKLVVQLSWRGR